MDMDEDFDGRGRVDLSRGYAFYVPGDIPRSLKDMDLSGDTLYNLTEAESALGDLSGTGRNLKNPQLLISPYMKREAVLSSKIEGAKASLTDLYQFEVGGLSSSEDVQEVKNYSEALEHGMKRIENGEDISLELLKDLHDILMDGVVAERGGEINTGTFRSVQNFIGGTTAEEATYVPPAPDRVPGLMDSLERFIQSPPKMSDLVNIGLIHYQFESIHPFADGNGRIGRLLIVLYLLKRDKLSQPLLYLSAYLNKNREDYYEHLLGVSKEGDYDSWLRFFLKGVREQSRDALGRARRIQELREDYIKEIRRGGGSDSFVKGIEFVFSKPVFTINDMDDGVESMSRSTASRVTRKLVEKGILEQVGDRSRNKRFKCPELLDLLEDEDMKFDEEETGQLTLTET
ncbi:MAG: Fic family protein [Candidatus Nanohalobium sp.]